GPARRTAGGAGRAGGSRAGIDHADRSQGSVMSDSSFRASCGRPAGLRRAIPAIRPTTCRAAFDATIPA
ncbi:hypothetical protein, partial [Burkholderia ambifaria]|uniref:hypothetical protein n=1 Tax=Burkholderia ambifaria TaxID=152480 RepID=UPI001E41EF3C